MNSELVALKAAFNTVFCETELDQQRRGAVEVTEDNPLVMSKSEGSEAAHDSSGWDSLQIEGHSYP